MSDLGADTDTPTFSRFLSYGRYQLGVIAIWVGVVFWVPLSLMTAVAAMYQQMEGVEISAKLLLAAFSVTVVGRIVSIGVQVSASFKVFAWVVGLGVALVIFYQLSDLVPQAFTVFGISSN